MGVPVSLLSDAPDPDVSKETAVYQLGTRIAVDTPGRVTAVLFWRLPDDAGQHVGRIWSATGQELAKVIFTNETASGWQEQALSPPLAIAPGLITVSVNTTGGHFAVQSDGLADPLEAGPLSSPINAGAYADSGFPRTGSPNGYYRDIVFEPDSTGRITITPDAAGGFVAALDGFTAGPYTLGVTLTSESGAVMTATRAIVMPMQSTTGA